VNEVIENTILYELFNMANEMFENPGNQFYEARYSGAVTIALHFVSQGRINEVELKAQKAAKEDIDKTEKIKKLTVEFVKKHEELNKLAEKINELEKE
jgi:hypothetical protein